MLNFLRRSRKSNSDSPSDDPYEKRGPALKEPPSLPEVIENLGTGLAQVRVSLLASPVWFADGAELILIGSVTEVIAKEWDFSHYQRGFVVALVYFGVFSGNLLSGPLGDEFGRRLPILVSFLLIFFFSILSALAWGFWSLCFFRFLVGTAIGIGQPAQQALVTETTPARWRIVFSSVSMFAFSFGEVYSGFLLLADDPQMKELHWRTLLVAAAVPSLAFGVAAFAFLQQSPLYLACGGRYDETQEVLETMRRDNHAPEVALDFKPYRVLCGGSGVKSQFQRMLGTILGDHFGVTTIVLVGSAFTINLAYYGPLYAFPQILASGVEVGSSPAMGVVLGGFSEMPGYVIGIIAILYFRRIVVLKLVVLILSVALGSFAIGGPHQNSGWVFGFLTYFGYYGTKCVVCMTFLVLYLYAAEVYPTSARTTGTALVIAGGRLASTFASLIYEAFLQMTGRWDTFFWLMCILAAVDFFVLRLLTIETFGKPAGGEADEPESEYGAASIH